MGMFKRQDRAAAIAKLDTEARKLEKAQAEAHTRWQGLKRQLAAMSGSLAFERGIATAILDGEAGGEFVSRETGRLAQLEAEVDAARRLKAALQNEAHRRRAEIGLLRCQAILETEIGPLREKVEQSRAATAQLERELSDLQTEYWQAMSDASHLRRFDSGMGEDLRVAVEALPREF